MSTIVFVQNSVRGFNQSAAQGYMYSAARALRKKLIGAKFYLWITHELPESKISLVQSAPDQVISIINYWCKRFSVDGSFADIFDGLHIGRWGDPSATAADIERFFSVHSPDDTRFFFCTSYPSDGFRKYVGLRGAKTIYLATAPAHPLDLSYDVVSDTYADREITLDVSGRVVSIIPAKYPIYFGISERDESLRTNRDSVTGKISAGKTVILTSGENIDKRLTRLDIINVIYPLMVNCDIAWTFVGVSPDRVRSMFMHHLGPSVGSKFLAEFGGSIHITPRVEHFPEFVRDNIDVFFSGNHTGGGTTCGLCVNLGIPVVEYCIADGRSFLPREHLCDNEIQAAAMILRILREPSFRRDLVRLQHENMWRSNLDWDRYLVKHL